MTEQEFVERFTKRIVELSAGEIQPFGQAPSHYAASVAPTYWRERFRDGLSPEQCADEDATYWES